MVVYLYVVFLYTVHIISSLSRELRYVDFDALGEHFAWYVLKHMWNQSRCNGTSERVTSQTRNL